MTNELSPTQIAKAPWHLTGNGYIFLYRFSHQFVEKNGFLADYQKPRFKGIIGAVMLVDYQTSGVGPYQELLFIPGFFDFDGKRAFSISKIYVSTYNSVWNGIENWGIPKELATFEKQELMDEKQEKIQVSIDGQTIFSAQLQKSWFKFPLTTALTPFTVAQALRGDLVLTKPTAKGQGQWAKLNDIWVNPVYFPDLSEAKPLAVIAVNNFEMVFPVAEFKKAFFE